MIQKNKRTAQEILRYVDEQAKVVTSFEREFSHSAIKENLIGNYVYSFLFYDFSQLDFKRSLQEIGYSELLEELHLEIKKNYNRMIAVAVSFPVRIVDQENYQDLIVVNLETSFSSTPTLFQLEYGMPHSNSQLALSAGILHDVISSKEVKQFLNVFHFPIIVN